MISLIEKIQELVDQGKIPKAFQPQLLDFYENYKRAAEENGKPFAAAIPLLHLLLDEVAKQAADPYLFPPYHEKITAPIDFYRFGLDFLRPLVQEEHSSVFGENRLQEISERLEAGNNVILLANHQTELDPQAISLMLETSYPNLAREMIFVAGHRVTTDPVAIPFSLGRNLLCIYSKNYLEHPPEKKMEKVHHNQRTMKKLRELLSEGGRCIYVAPSGGRDRKNKSGVIEVASFDPQSIEMFWFTAQHSARPTHFYPLALSTYDLLPPPPKVEVAIGEQRLMRTAPIHLAFGAEIAMDTVGGLQEGDKKERRARRAEAIWHTVRRLYEEMVARG